MLNALARGKVAHNYFTSVWGNPTLELNITIIPTRLTQSGARRNGANIRDIPFMFPGNLAYHVYAIGYLHSGLLHQTKIKQGEWQPLVELMQQNRSHIRLSYLNSRIVPDVANCYMLGLGENGYFLIVPDDGVATELHVTIRSSKLTSAPIAVDTYPLTDQYSRDLLFTQIDTDADSEMKEYYVDNYLIDVPTRSQINAANQITIIDDTSIGNIIEIPMEDLHTYSVSGTRFYLLHYPTIPKGMLFNINDLFIVLVNQGVCYAIHHSAYKDTVVRLANNACGLATDAVESVMASLGWTYAGTRVKLLLGTNTKPRQAYNFDYQRIWDAMSDVRQSEVLRSQAGSPHELTALGRHGKPTNKFINATQSVVNANVENLYAINELDRILNRGVRAGRDIDNSMTDLANTEGLVGMRFIEGDWVEDYPQTLSGDESAVWIEHRRETMLDSNSVELSSYLTPVVYKADGTFASEGAEYTVNNGFIYPLDEIYITELQSAKTLHPTYDVAKMEWTVPNLKRWVAATDMHVFADNVYLHPGTDYRYTDTGIQIWKAVSVDDVKIKASPKLGECILEQGFIRNGTLSVNGSYLAEDPDNIAMFIGDKLYLADEVAWEEDYHLSTATLPNGVPYTIFKRLLHEYELTADELLALRTEHQSLLSKIGTYLNLVPPEPITDVSVYTDHYRLQSPFMLMLLDKMRRGVINYSPNYVVSVGVEFALGQDLMHQLSSGLDPLTKTWGTKAIDVIPHLEIDPMPVTSDAWAFLEKVNDTLLDGKLQLNSYYRIKR